MSGLYWSADQAQLKTFSAASKRTAKGLETIVKIEISVTEHYAISSMLHQLDEISREQDAAKQPARKTPTTKAKPLALPAPLLQLPYLGDDE